LGTIGKLKRLGAENDLNTWEREREKQGWGKGVQSGEKSHRSCRNDRKERKVKKKREEVVAQGRAARRSYEKRMNARNSIDGGDRRTNNYSKWQEGERHERKPLAGNLHIEKGKRPLTTGRRIGGGGMGQRGVFSKERLGGGGEKKGAACSPETRGHCFLGFRNEGERESGRQKGAQGERVWKNP